MKNKSKEDTIKESYFFQSVIESFGEKSALALNVNSCWQALTFSDIKVLSEKLASFLIQNNIKQDDKVAILSESRPEWHVTFLASLLAGTVFVPLDIKLTFYELVSIFKDCKAKILFVSSFYLELGLKLKEEIESIEQIVIINKDNMKNNYYNIYNFSSDYKIEYPAFSKEKTILIVYTSGTTGLAKGVEISLNNIISQIKSMQDCFKLNKNCAFLSILPMNHLFEFVIECWVLYNGNKIYYSQKLTPKDIFNIIQSKNITHMAVVPAFLKLVKSGIESKISQLNKIQKLYLKFIYILTKFIPVYSIKRLLFWPITKIFGLKFEGFISGAAPLNADTGKFFENIGIRIFEGYGLSEASPIVSVNTPQNYKFGSVGMPLPNVKVKTDEKTGELLVKGGNVMKGYYKQPELTAQVIDTDCWLHTGDIAKIDKEGFIFITGRIKNMIVLSGGKKVFPEDLEAVFGRSPKFEEVCVFGAQYNKGQKGGTENVFVAVVPAKELLESLNDEELTKIIREEIKMLSDNLSSYKKPSNVFVLKEPFPKTTTRKIKRNEVKNLALNLPKEDLAKIQS